MLIKLRSGRARRGQSMVEFALIVPIFVLVLVGLLDGGRAIYAYNTVANAARVGARVAIVNQDPVAVRDATINEAVGLSLTGTVCGTNLCGPDVTYTSCATDGCTISVTVTYDFEAATPLLGGLFNPDIGSTATMTIERVNP